MRASIPQHMQAVLLDAMGQPLTIGRIATPHPEPGQVLIRMAAAPINPSDPGFTQGSYAIQAAYPLVPGFEGSGTVVAAGPGLLPRLWLGQRVACSAPPSAGGTWAEYLVTSATSCLPLPRQVSLEQGATLLVNPLTALAFLDIAKHGKHAAIVNNAAASALGQMILRLGRQAHIPIIHLVRRPAQEMLLRSLGAEHILDSSQPDFIPQLHTLATQLSATLILDPVGGEQAQTLLDVVPSGGVLVQYGSLANQRYEVVASSDQKHVMGFFLADWIAKRSRWQLLLDLRQVRRFATTIFQTTIQQRFPLAQVHQAIEWSRANPTKGKVLLIADPAAIPMQ